MILITSIICMGLVYYLMDAGLAIGFMSALVVEIFSLLTLYNILKNTEQRVKNNYDSIVEGYREREKKYEDFIIKAKELYPDLESRLKEEKKKPEQNQEENSNQENEEA